MSNLAETIFLMQLDVMKSILDLGKYGLRNDDESYKYFKRISMDSFYGGLKKLFEKLEDDGILKRCDCASNLRHGYTQCTLCHGAGFTEVKNSGSKNPKNKEGGK